MFPYGITPLDLEIQTSKREKQIDYLANSNFTSLAGTPKTLLEINMNANISERYYARLINKVNTLQQIMTNEGLIPIFLTITHDGWLQRLFCGDYSKFDELKHLCKLPENDKYGFLRTKASKRLIFDEHDLYMVLRWNWERFNSERTSRKMREFSKVGYIFATEPHDSGVPHAHVLMYIPSEFRDDLLQDFKRIFDAPRNIAQSKRKRNSKKGLTSEQIKNGEINGFQWTLSNPVGYILKYVTKSFMDIKNQSQIDELEAWYMKHRISRISTSHSLIPQWVYQKIYPLQSDWLYLSNLKTDGVCEWSQEDDFFKFEDFNMKQTFLYNRGVYQHFINGKLEREFGSPKEPKEINIMRQEDRPISSSRPRPLPYPITINNIVFHSFLRSSIQRKTNHKKKNYPIQIIYPNGLTINVNKVSASKMNSRDLLELYYSFNLETCDLKHFGVIKNECIKRNLIDGLILPINEFSTNIENINEVNPYEIEMDKARTFFICRESIISYLSVNNTILEIGA